MSTIKKKYYTISEIASECNIYPSKIMHWIKKGLCLYLGPINRSKNRRLFSKDQRGVILKFAGLMATGRYTILGGLFHLYYVEK